MAQFIKKPRIIQVAELAGVSPMTVTRTLNNSAPVAEATRKRVLDAAASLGYKPDPFARAMRGCKTKSVGIIWGLCGPHSSVGIIRDMTWTLNKLGYATYINDNFSEAEPIRRLLSEYIERRVDGLIFSVSSQSIAEDAEIAALIRQIPAVVTESPDDHTWPCDKLILDVNKPMDDIVDYFAKTGRRRLAAIADYPSLQPRIDLFEKRLERNGLETQGFFVQRDMQDGLELGQSFVKGLVKAYPDGKYPFDAVWASCDEGAAALMAHFAKAGIKVPDDIAVAGFNNNETSQYMTPPLASVERMNAKVVASAMKMLLNRIDNPDSPLAKETIRMKFVPRLSAGKKGASR